MNFLRKNNIVKFIFIPIFFISPHIVAEEKELSLEVTKFQLANGLTVLLHEDHSVPLVNMQTWYKVGSVDESPGATGAAHMLEHMMFKGAKKFSGSDFENILHKNGIDNNAFTTNDYTGFYENIPSGQLKLMMEIEVDRMSSLALNEESLKTEKEIVKEERRLRVDNQPMGVLDEVMMETVFKTSNYRWPVIGTMKDIENYNSKNLKEFYEKFYGPNNAVLTLVGDFNTSTVRKMIEDIYGILPIRSFQEVQSEIEPEQKRDRYVEISKHSKNIIMSVAFRSSKITDEDHFAMDLIANIIGGGVSSRLHKSLVVDKQLSMYVNANQNSFKKEGIFYIITHLKPEIEETDRVGAAIYRELWKIQNQNVTLKELKKAKTYILKDKIDLLKTFEGKASALAMSEVETGNYANLFSDLKKYEAITVEDLRRVAKKYLNPSQRNLVILKPKK